MSSLVVKPTSTSPSPSPSLSPFIFSSRSGLFSSLSFPRKANRRCILRTRAYGSSDFKNSGIGDSKPSNGTLLKSRREILLEYVKNVQPEFLELFVKRAPKQVVDAMRQTITNMIGTLPPQFFAVTVTTVAENLAQLMYSVMMTGYMFSNAQYRLELQQSLEQVTLPDVQEKKVNMMYDAVPTRVYTRRTKTKVDPSGHWVDPDLIQVSPRFGLLMGIISSLRGAYKYYRRRCSVGYEHIY